MLGNKTIDELFNSVGLKEKLGKQLFVLYGQINQEVIVSTIKLTERKLVLEKVPINIITKTKIVCIEMLQNVLKHQSYYDGISPNFIIRLSDNGLSIISSNIVTAEEKNTIITRLDSFSKIKTDDFRSYYINSFKDATLSNEGDAGLGLLDIVYRSKQNFNYKMEPISEGLFAFSLNVVIPQTLPLAS